jgi:hypothetical protein
MCSWHVKGQLYQWYHVKAFIQNHHVTPSCLREHHIIRCTGHVPQILRQQEKQWVYTAIAQLVEQIWLARRTSDWSPWQHLPTPTHTLIQENVYSNFTRNVLSVHTLHQAIVSPSAYWSSTSVGVINTLTGQDSFVGANANGLISSPWNCTRWCNKGTNVTHSSVSVLLDIVSQMSLISADNQGLKCSWLTTCAFVCNTLCEWVSQTYPGCCVYHFMVRAELRLDVNQVSMAMTAWYHSVWLTAIQTKYRSKSVNIAHQWLVYVKEHMRYYSSHVDLHVWILLCPIKCGLGCKYYGSPSYVD